MATLELGLLYEINRLRLKDKPSVLIQPLEFSIGLQVKDSPLEHVVTLTVEINWTCDPFDRLIISQANLAGIPLITKDWIIRENFAGAVW